MVTGVTIGLVIFDCDGVLVDSEVLVAGVVSDELSEAGFPVSVAQLLERFVGTSNADMFARIEGDFRRSIPGHVIEAIELRTQRDLRAHLKPVDGIETLLKGDTRPRCVASSSDPARIAQSLGVCGLDGYFDPARIFSSSMVTRGKPAPDLFLLAARRCGAEPDSCVVIEDSAVGVRAAHAAGMTPVGFVAGSHATDALAGQLRKAGAATIAAEASELAEILDQLDGHGG